MTPGAFFYGAGARFRLLARPGCFGALSRLAAWVFENAPMGVFFKALGLVFSSWRVLAVLGAFAAGREGLRKCPQGCFFTALGARFRLLGHPAWLFWALSRLAAWVFENAPRGVFFTALGLVFGSWRLLDVLGAFAACRVGLRKFPQGRFYGAGARFRAPPIIKPCSGRYQMPS